MKIGINMDSFNNIKIDDREYIKKISQLGFSATFSTVYDITRQTKVADACAEYGVKYESLHAPFGHINDIWFDGINGDTMLNEMLECIDRCEMVGADVAVVHMSSGENAPPVTDIGRYRFTKLIEYANQKNVKVAFENQRKLSNISWALETFTAEDNVGFCWDCGHESCFAPGREYMSLFGDRLIYTHIHDNLGIYNQDDHLIPFDGKIDYNKWAEHIKKSNYKGTLTLESFSRKSDIYDNLSIDEYLEKAAASAKKLVDMITNK